MAGTDDIGRQQVGGELDPAKRPFDGSSERPGEGGFAHAGHVLDEHVSPGDERREHEIDRLGLAFEDALDIPPELPHELENIAFRNRRGGAPVFQTPRW